MPPIITADTERIIAEAIGAILIALATFHFSRREKVAAAEKDNAGASQSIAAAADVTTNTAIRLIDELRERLNEEIKERKQEQEQNRLRIDGLERENRELRTKIMEQNEIIRAQAETIDDQAKRIRQLESRGLAMKK